MFFFIAANIFGQISMTKIIVVIIINIIIIIIIIIIVFYSEIKKLVLMFFFSHYYCQNIWPNNNTNIYFLYAHYFTVEF